MNKTYLLPICAVLMLGMSCNTEPCDFNIDKIEIMAHLNIPSITDNFYCDKVDGVKITCFEFDSLALEKTQMNDLIDYANRYNFEESDAIEGRRFVRDLEHNISFFQQMGDGGRYFYKKEGASKNATWQVFLDIETGKMWVRIEDSK